ncbi:hypothetical protein [Antarcticimicrobium luteum]|uniref:Uncharacterized protein n=1 Tax=Antarcticimicrobium luteum TaxID=2547397 RepID=A0A4R5UXI1_9RHOB|nr:hypothetical protein [Antarcticimicrobium luteum]TDK43835.1 hypothetical protein E1832_16285 [Antarcticimicrobium luteum]
MLSIQHQTTLEDLIAETCTRARSFSTAINGAQIACSAREASFIRRCLAAIRDGRLFGQDADGALQAVRDVLCREVANETLGFRPVFDGYHDPDFGDMGRALSSDPLANLLLSAQSVQSDLPCFYKRIESGEYVSKNLAVVRPDWDRARPPDIVAGPCLPGPYPLLLLSKAGAERPWSNLVPDFCRQRETENTS